MEDRANINLDNHTLILSRILKDILNKILKAILNILITILQELFPLIILISTILYLTTLILVHADQIKVILQFPRLLTTLPLIIIHNILLIKTRLCLINNKKAN
jgi:hypothetical protein